MTQNPVTREALQKYVDQMTTQLGELYDASAKNLKAELARANLTGFQEMRASSLLSQVQAARKALDKNAVGISSQIAQGGYELGMGFAVLDNEGLRGRDAGKKAR